MSFFPPQPPMDARYMQHSQPVFGTHIAFIASEFSYAASSIRAAAAPTMIRRNNKPQTRPSQQAVGAPPVAQSEPLAPPWREKMKKYLPFSKRKSRNKERLWVALYRYTGPGAKGGDDVRWQGLADPDKIAPAVDPEERKYHWAFLVGPKHEHPIHAVPGLRYELAQDLFTGKWKVYRHYEIDVKNTGPTMLVRMLVGKIVDKERFQHVVYATPADEESQTYRNKAWAFEVLAALRDSVGRGVMSRSSRLDWREVGVLVKDMCVKRAAAGVFDGPHDHNQPRPAFDLMGERWVWEGVRDASGGIR